MDSCCCSLNGKINLTLECEIFNWKNPYQSGLYLTIFNLGFIALSLTQFNLISLGSYLLLFYVISGIAICKFLKGDGAQGDDAFEHVSKDSVENFIKKAYKFAFYLDEKFKSIVSFEDKTLTIKFLLFTYFAASCTCECCLVCFGWFGNDIINLGVNFLFIWAYVYNSNKKLIDENFSKFKKIATSTYGDLKGKIPRYQGKDE